MSDDLVKRLRETSDDWPACLVALEQEAASRIEKLEAALREITESARLVGDYYHVKIARKALEAADD